MRKTWILTALLSLAFLGATARAQELSPADKDRAMQYLEPPKRILSTRQKVSVPHNGISNLPPTAGPSPK